MTSPALSNSFGAWASPARHGDGPASPRGCVRDAGPPLLLHPLQSILLLVLCGREVGAEPSGAFRAMENQRCGCLLAGETSLLVSPADKELWSEARSSDHVGSEGNFSCRCGTAMTWRFLSPLA